MSYDFKNLSSADFEDLVCDLIGKELGVRFEAFCIGPDGGIDGRHSKGDGSTIILQAKHYEGSPFSKLKSAMKRERKSIDTLAPSRYLLATSCKFTPPSKAELVTIIGSSLKSEADIFGPEDINGLLRKYPDILKAHIKLWLSGTEVLERVLRSAAHAYATITREDIEQKVRVYAHNPSFDQSLEKLDKHHVLIVSGPPGVGKTTLAEMLCYTFLSEEWELVPIRNLEDGFAAIADTKKQIFLFDDFLGRVALDKQALAHKDSELARFISRISRSPNARFVLTTRAYIFEEARTVSEHIGNQRLEVTKYILDVGIYTRRIKARILYNHLLVADTPKAYIRALIEGNSLTAIIDHRNYSPRVIEAMTDALRVGDIEPDAYPKEFLQALNDPSLIWDKPFRKHIDDRCRHLLLSMFFGSEYGIAISELRSTYESLHSSMSAFYGLSHGPKDFEEALRVLEGSFLNIEGEKVSYLNPSLRDYLSSYLLDSELLARMAPTAKSVDWVYALWKFSEHKFLMHPDQQMRIAQACVTLLDMFEKQPVWKPSRRNPRSYEIADASHSVRLDLLIGWWKITNDVRFADSAMVIARNPIQGFSPWRDGTSLIGFFTQLTDIDYGPEFIYLAEFLALIENHLSDLIRWASSDDLESIADAIEEAGDVVPAKVISALEEVIREEFDEIDSRVKEEDSESALSEKIDLLNRLAPRYGISDKVLESAISTIKNRIAEIDEHTTSAPSPQFKSSKDDSHRFDDEALKNLFSLLLDE